MKKPSLKFEENYFLGSESTYSKYYTYKAENIATTFNERAIPYLKKYARNDAKILDTACAFGDLLKLLDQKKYQTYGIDISSFAINKAKNNTKAQLSVGDLNKKMKYTSNFFDVIFALDIIEHLNSPYLFLSELNRVLKKNGILFIQTPNINSIFELFSKDNWFGYQDESHLHLFNRKSLEFLLKKSGFSIISSQTVASTFPKSIRLLLKNTDIGGNIWIIAKKK